LTLRAAVIGARRRRQGTGAFVAAALHGAGCDVSAVLGTRLASAEEARDALKADYGIECVAYDSLSDLLEREAPDVVAVCSPAEVHAAHVQEACEAGCHVFCEKPLFWEEGMDAEAVRQRAGTLVQGFEDRGRYLALNTQWPFTLDAFRELHPQAFEGPLAHFEMVLGPIGTGPRMVVDSGSHLLSMLQLLAGPGVLQDVTVIREAEASMPETMVVDCTYENRVGSLQASLRLVHSPNPPRPAGYSINGFSARRSVELAPYRVSFSSEGRSVPVPDPTTASVQAFLASVRAGERPNRTAIVNGMTQLQELVTAAERP
jgi:hypothetical protein